MRTVAALVLASLAVLGSSCGGDDAPEAARTAISAQPTAPGALPSATSTTAPGVSIQLVRVAEGLSRPVALAHAGDGTGRLFIVEKVGRIRVVRDGGIAAGPFLDISSLVNSSGNEQGLLGLAFHPDFRTNGRFFVYYTAKAAGANTVAEYRAPLPSSDAADPGSGRVLLAIPDTRSNHNGGQLAFGPDGFLYAGTGDGGGAGDPDRSAQDRNHLFGKILRIDVDRGDPYGIPADNPFVAQGNAKPEVWALGLRNPWRFSFDRATGDLWIGDVGQNAIEEVDVIPEARRGGLNFGWSVVEGTRCFREPGCSVAGFTPPVFEYTHDDGGCSVTGGYVYRGRDIPALTGRYLFADYCQRPILALRRDGERFVADTVVTGPGSIGSFGEDETGEIYVLADREGAVYRLAPAGR
jgi:glucose/arabinose dehydrogenase